MCRTWGRRSCTSPYPRISKARALLDNGRVITGMSTPNSIQTPGLRVPREPFAPDLDFSSLFPFSHLLQGLCWSVRSTSPCSSCRIRSAMILVEWCGRPAKAALDRPRFNPHPCHLPHGPCMTAWGRENYGCNNFRLFIKETNSFSLSALLSLHAIARPTLKLVRLDTVLIRGWCFLRDNVGRV